jgi:hypothetical protein
MNKEKKRVKVVITCWYLEIHPDEPELHAEPVNGIIWSRVGLIAPTEQCKNVTSESCTQAKYPVL